MIGYRRRAGEHLVDACLWESHRPVCFLHFHDGRLVVRTLVVPPLPGMAQCHISCSPAARPRRTDRMRQTQSWPCVSPCAHPHRIWQDPGGLLRHCSWNNVSCPPCRGHIASCVCLHRVVPRDRLILVPHTSPIQRDTARPAVAPPPPASLLRGANWWRPPAAIPTRSPRGAPCRTHTDHPLTPR